MKMVQFLFYTDLHFLYVQMVYLPTIKLNALQHLNGTMWAMFGSANEEQQVI